MKTLLKLALGLFAILFVIGLSIEPPPDESAPGLSEACSDAFAAAAAADPMRDTPEDLFPAYTACTSLEEWRAADEAHPDAIERVEDPVMYARTFCAINQAALGASPICQAANRPSEAEAASPLELSGETGLLDVPLPIGVALLEATPGDPDAGRDPQERYSIDATVEDIAGFYAREMPDAGWSRTGTSSTETRLVFRKGGSIIGVLIDGAGGSFTLMGS